MIALSENNGDEAISLFKTALDASETEQFWFSFIDAIQEKQFEKAEKTINQQKITMLSRKIK